MVTERSGPRPLTRDRLAADFAALGVAGGDSVLLHSSLRSLGRVLGGPGTVIGALLEVLGHTGTLVTPAQTPNNKDPSRWFHRPVPVASWPTIRAHAAAFDPATSACREVGLIAETLRTWPGAVRSAHPQTSFAAVGARAQELMAVHDLTSELGERSPLRALAAAGGHCLLLGVDFNRCTSFHLAEYRQPRHPRKINVCVVDGPLGPQWISYPGRVLDASDFVELGTGFTRTGAVRSARVGAATARYFPIHAAVEYATSWFPRHRGHSAVPGTNRI